MRVLQYIFLVLALAQTQSFGIVDYSFKDEPSLFRGIYVSFESEVPVAAWERFNTLLQRKDLSAAPSGSFFGNRVNVCLEYLSPSQRELEQKRLGKLTAEFKNISFHPLPSCSWKVTEYDFERRQFEVPFRRRNGNVDPLSEELYPENPEIRKMAPLMASASYRCELEKGRYGMCFSKVAIGGIVEDVVVIEFSHFVLYFPLSRFNDEGRALMEKYYFYGWSGEFHKLFDLKIHHQVGGDGIEFFEVQVRIREIYRAASN